jgi:uncharacterized protein YmfQ (DUF2313 family)
MSSQVEDTLFHAQDLDGATRELADHLPDGRAFGAKVIPGTNTRALVAACAVALNRVQQQICELAQQYHVPLTSDLLVDWEKSVGIPDECLDTALTLAERRQNVIDRLRRAPIVTKAEFEELGTALLGEPVTVDAGAEIEIFPLQFPVVFSSSPARFKMFVNLPGRTGFPYAFPIPFGAARSELLECVFRKLAPANVVVIFR